MEKAPKTGLKVPKRQKLYSPKQELVRHLVPSHLPRNQDGRRKISYCVTYTWNRGGRLKELRTRHLARKFLYLWMKKTFGSVLPSCAKCHYDKKILQKTFEEWKEEWWVLCREWKLVIRADCHYRYFLYNLAFQAWKTYTGERREQRKLRNVADAHAAKTQTLCMWERWLSYVALRRIKHRMSLEALRFRERSSLCLAWRLWGRRQSHKRVLSEMDGQALQHWARSLQLRAWLQWKELCAGVKKAKAAEARALVHFQHRGMGKCMKSWRVYVQLRRQKQHRHELALRHCQAHRLLRCLSGWQLAWERKQQLHLHQERLVQLARRTALRRAFMRWKCYVVLCAETAAQHEQAERCSRLRFLRWGFHALRKNVRDVSAQRIRRNLAHQQYQVALLHRFWDSWKSRLEEKEQRQQWPLMMAAQTHSRVVLMRKCLEVWTQRVHLEKHWKIQCTKADRHYATTILPVTFQAWKRFKDHQGQWREMKGMASGFHRETCTRRWFERWQLRVRQEQERERAEEEALLHHERKLLSQFWGFWHRRTVTLLEEREGMSLAKGHHNRHVLQKSFWLWQENVEEMKEERRAERRASRFRSIKLLQRSWGMWRQYLRRRSAKWKQQVRAERHFQQALLGKVLVAWKTYQSQVRHILSQVAIKETRRNKELLRQLLGIWKEHVADGKRERRQLALAEQHSRKAALSKALCRWREAASLCLYRRQQKAAAVARAKERLLAVRLKVLFLHWKESCARSLEQRGQLIMAAGHHRRQLLGKCIVQWKRYHFWHVRHRLCQRQGDWLLNQRLLSTYFLSWKMQLAHRRWEQQATRRALWHWSLVLQGKALDAWLGFVLEQKRKRRRVQRALEAYQAELLREGVSRVLGYTAGLKRLRGAAQTQQQLRVACHLHQAVYHCAMRWKQKALCQKHRQALPRGSPQKRVTFEMPVSTSATASGTAPSRAQSDHLDLFQAAGDSVFTELSAARQARLQPRRPDFLAESLERAEVPSPALGRLESPAGALQQLLPRCLPTPAGVLLPSAAKRGLSPSETDYSQLLGTSSWPQSSPLPRPELLPPSSFRPRVKEKPETATCSGLQPPLHITSPLLEEAWKEAKGGSPKGNLLLPRDFTRSKSPPTPPFAGRAGIRGEGNQVAPITKEATVHKQLKAELQCIGKKMRHYHNHQQELRLCRQQERLLSTWLEMRTGAETQADIWEVQESLAQLKGRITSLLQALGEERPLVQSYISHLQDLRAAFGPKAGSPPRGAPGLPLESRASLPSGGAALRR